MTGPLASRAFDTLWLGFRPATLATHQCMFNVFLAFLVVLELSLHRISTLNILAFMESGMSPDNIGNHLTAIRSLCTIYACDTTPFRDQRLPLFVKSLKINRSFQPKITFMVEDQLLLKIITVSQHLPHSLSFHSFILIYFLFFFKIVHMLQMRLILPGTFVLEILYFQVWGYHSH